MSADGRREVLGFDVGDSENGAFWTGFLRALKARGLHGEQLVISDAHTGLKVAVGSVLLGAGWHSENCACCTGSLRALKARGLHGEQLVISDAHTGLKVAVGSVLLGAGWQR